jgi:type I restriction enzyme R subunit
MTKSLKKVLSVESLDDAEREDTLEEDIEDQLIAEMRARGPQPNVSTFAFTATPKDKTLELFGTKRDDGGFVPFSLYTMRQAIEENFILDVLENYTTYETYWRLLKKVEEDPAYDVSKASRLLAAFAGLHEHAIGEKVRVMAEHFHEKVAHRIKGKAKAMIVTRSRLHAVRYYRALDRYLREHGVPYEAMVAFSGTVKDPDSGLEYTERQMNGVPDTQTKEAFNKPENRFLVVANKFQTGFDQPLLHTMYVDKKLGGVNAVQTLSRLNRTHPGKGETMVMDFANEAEAIQVAFEPYYEATLLSEGTDPAILDDLQHRIEDFHLFGVEELDAFARGWFEGEPSQDKLYAILRPVRDRWEALEDDNEKEAFRGALDEYVRLFAFLSQILTYQDPELERLYLFGRYLKRYLPAEPGQLPREIQGMIDIESFRIDKTSEGSISLTRGEGELDPRGPKGDVRSLTKEEIDRLSAIIKELNDRFGANLTEEDRISLAHLEQRLTGDAGLQAAARANTRDNVQLTFKQKVEDYLQDMSKSNFRLYKRITDDREFGRRLVEFLFEGFWEGREGDNADAEAG